MTNSLRRTARSAILVSATYVALTGLTGHTGAPTDPAPGPAPSAVTTSIAPVRQGPAPAHVGRPTRLVVPRIDLDEPLYGVGLKPDGAMQTPDFGDVGWYDVGPRPGARGPAVIVAHVHGPDGDDVFADLHELQRGDTVIVRRTDGVSRFVVDAVEQSAKDALPTGRIWNRTDRAVLRLITCGGVPDPMTRMYPENTVVYAHLAG